MKKKLISLSFLIVVASLVVYNTYEEIPFLHGFIQTYKIDVVKRKLNKNPYSVELHHRLAQLYLEQGDLNKYKEELQLLSEISEESYIYSVKLGDHFFKTEQYEAAIKSYKEAISLYRGKDIMLHFKMGNAYLNIDNKEEAIKEYRIQLEILRQMNEPDRTGKMISFIEKLIKDIEQGGNGGNIEGAGKGVTEGLPRGLPRVAS